MSLSRKTYAAVAFLVPMAGLAALAAGALRLAPKEAHLPPPPEEAVERAEPGRRGVKEAEILFGMASPFTGPNRELGAAMKAGIEAAFAEVNAAGGVHGRSLRLVALDDGYEPTRTVSVLKQLVEGEEVFAIVGNVGTPTAAVAIPWCMERKTIFFGAYSGGDCLRRNPPDRYVFNFRPSYAEETAAAVRHLVEVRGIPPGRIGVFAQEDEFGESGWRGAAAALAARGVPAARVVRAGYRRNFVDVDGAVQAVRARAGELDAVVMVATYRAAAAFIRKCRDAGLRLVFTNVSAVDADSLADELVHAGPGYTADVIVTQVVPLPGSRAEAIAGFRRALARHAPGAKPGSVALEGWLVGNLLAEGLRRAGRDLDTEALVRALEGIRDLDLGTGALLSFGPARHQASDAIWLHALRPDGGFALAGLE